MGERSMPNASGIAIQAVRSESDLKAFISFPRELYRDSPLWAPPVWATERGEYRPRNNPVLGRSPHALFLARRGERLEGRILVYADPRYNAEWKSDLAFFGSFESVDDAETARALLSAAEAWSSAQGMTALRGPINPVAECWGVLVEGFGKPPVFMAPWNPPYYDSLMAAGGYAKAKDLIAYEADGGRGYEIPVRFSRFVAMAGKRLPGISLRRMDKKRFDRDAELIRGILNESVAGNWGFVPVEEGEMRAIAAKLSLIVDPDAVWFVEDGGRAVACCLGFPDINVLLRKIHGRLLPFGMFRLLSGIKRLKDYRLWGLAVLPEYQGKGLDVLLYERLFRALAPKGVRLEANYILEDNWRIRKALEKLGMERVATYRVYEKNLLPGMG